MGFFDFLKKPNWEHLDKNVPEGFFEVPPSFGHGGYCSDDLCDCDNTFMPKGSGYLYISQDLVTFRNDARSIAACQEKLNYQFHGKPAFLAPGVASPIFCCEKAVRKRGLDIEVASGDAKYWWNTGLVPLRPTPKEKNSFK
jgi:hypothetical protein